MTARNPRHEALVGEIRRQCLTIHGNSRDVARVLTAIAAIKISIERNCPTPK